MKLAAIVGPTASGKTDLAIKLAKKFNGELISADSRQMYRQMDIGTAKPTGGKWKKIRGEKAYLVKGVRIFLIDIVSPDKFFTVSQFQKRANLLIKKIVQSGKLPILVGGTGLYVKAVTENLFIPEVKPNVNLRKKLERDLKQKGLKYLYKKLLKLDPEARKFMDPQNQRRVIRALEVCLITGKSFSSLRVKGVPQYDALTLGIVMARSKLYKRIDDRVDRMFKMGLVKEVRALSKKYKWSSPGMSGLGYKQFENFLEGRATLDQTKSQIKKLTRRYAKRQLTWFRHQHQVTWIKNQTQAQNVVKKFLSKRP